MPGAMMNPFAALNQLHREVNRLFDGYMPSPGEAFGRTAVFPALNVWEDADTVHAEAEIPGVGPEDLEVYAVGDELTIRGVRKPREGENVAYHRRERGTGEFTRVVTLPVSVNPDQVKAVLKDGVLTVTLPKAEEARPRRITVKTG